MYSELSSNNDNNNNNISLFSFCFLVLKNLINCYKISSLKFDIFKNRN